MVREGKKPSQATSPKTKKKKKVKNRYLKGPVVSKTKGTGVLGVDSLRMLPYSAVRIPMEQTEANRRVCSLQSPFTMLAFHLEPGTLLVSQAT